MSPQRDRLDFLDWLTSDEGPSLAAVERKFRAHFKPAQPVREYLADHDEPDADEDYDGPRDSVSSWDR